MLNRHSRVLACVALLTTATVAGSGRAVAAPSELEFGSGGDLLAASAVFHLTLPADFFGPGSPAFTGDIPAAGVQIGTLGPYEVGTASLVLERRSGPVQLGPYGNRVYARIDSLSLIGLDPVDIVVNGTMESWAVSAAMVDAHAEVGTYDLDAAASSGGAVVASLPVSLVYTFQRGDLTKVYLPGSIILRGNAVSTSWAPLSGSPSAGLAVPGLSLGVALSGVLSSSSLDLSLAPAELDLGRPGPAYVDPSAVIDPGVASLGRDCSIGAGVSIGAMCVIGPGAVIGEGAQIDDGAIVGAGASIGEGATLSTGAYVDSGAVLGPSVFMGADSYIGSGATLGQGCTVGCNAYISNGCVVRRGSHVGDGAQLGAGVQTGAAVSIGAGLEIAERSRIAAHTELSNAIVTFVAEDGTSEPRSLPTDSWETPPYGVVRVEFGFPGLGSGATNQVSTLGETVGPANQPPGWGQLPADIGGNIAHPRGGGTGPEYSDGYTMCGWYAEALRKKLEALGYSTSFTCVEQLNSEWKWWKVRTEKWIKRHTLTDIHWPNGAITWLEAQCAGQQAISEGARAVDPDDNKKVTYWNGACVREVSDGNLSIRVYGSRAEAEAAGEGVSGY